MPDADLEITQKAVRDFVKVPKYMMSAKEENAMKTYADLKREYLSLKAFLNVASVNLTDIDKIEE